MISSITQNSTKTNCIIGQWGLNIFSGLTWVLERNTKAQTKTVGRLSFALKRDNYASIKFIKKT